MRKIQLLFVLCLFSVISIGASGEVVGGNCGINDCDSVKWSYDTETTVLTISGNGSMNSYSETYIGGAYVTTAPWQTYYQEMTKVVIGDSVTSIGKFAFLRCSDLTSVTIGNSVTSIGEYAFYGCSNMNGLYFNADSLSKYCFPSSLTKVIIGKNVKIIPSSFISGNSNITNIEIPNSVTSIGYRAFLVVQV